MSIWKCDILTVIPGRFSRRLPSIKRRAVISISTSLTRVSLPTRSKPIAQWFTASQTFEDGGYSVTWLTEVEVAPRILALARLAFPVRRGSIARTRTVRCLGFLKRSLCSTAHLGVM
ncbi:hypothetical protein ALC57_06013 [Trachymyrmex cornetzi]|uniref:Uncharacterized protein n=1 Tax=Trachymyrmex cornetzi TaxID=471704 RepID=A0A151J9E0_9HYME|nr:hypothetical protein ALC57_06013 [Trachymyrmex cornetzi]